MTSLSCILVDDEPLARQALAALVAEVPGLTLHGAFPSARAAEAFLDGASVDLVFLDIQMPERSGLDFAHGLVGGGLVGGGPLIVFTTAHAAYAADSYNVDALDYLVKPIRLDRLLRAVEKARAYAERVRSHAGAVSGGADGKLLVRADRRMYRVAHEDIRYVQGMKDYAMLHLADRKLMTATTLAGLAERLPPATFLRVSKSYLVNLAHVVAYDSHTVYLNGEELPLSPLHRETFGAAFEGRREAREPMTLRGRRAE